MADVRVRVGQPDLKVRIGQQNAVKILSSVANGASFADNSTNAVNVIGGKASVTQLNVSGVSTFVGVATFKSSAYIDNNLYISNDLTVDEFTARNGTITSIATISGGLYYGSYYSYGMPYFNSSGLIVSTPSPQNGIDYSNYIMTTDNSGIPVWSTTIDGGSY